MDTHNNPQDQIFDTLRRFQCIRNPLLRWLVGVLPLLIIGFILFDAVALHGCNSCNIGSNPMFLTGLLTAAVALFSFNILLGQAPETLYILWTRNVVMPLAPLVLPSRETHYLREWLARIWSIVTNDAKTEAAHKANMGQQFYHFIVDFEARLNNWGAPVTGVVLALIMYESFPYRFTMRGYGGDGRYWAFGWLGFAALGGWTNVAGCLAQIVIAFVMGLLLWRMLIVGNMVIRLAHDFGFDIQINHPDRCGGLRPLGDLCFINALIISLPGIFLGGWILALSYAFKVNPPLYNRYISWQPFYEWLLLVNVILAFMAFFHPLNAVHNAMARTRIPLRREVDAISLRIDELTHQLLRAASTTHAVEVQDQAALNQQLDQLRTTYANVSDIPVWPFDRRIILKFVSAQAIPLLTLTGVGQSVLDVVSGLLSMIPSS